MKKDKSKLANVFTTFFSILSVSVLLILFIYLSNKNNFKINELDKQNIVISKSPKINSIQTTKLTYVPPENVFLKPVTQNVGCLNKIPDDHFHKPHLVNPPAGKVTLVCCSSTKGILNIAVHLDWAPNGAKRFLEMVNSNFFESDVPLFRALKGFLVQFGLAGSPYIQKQFDEKGLLIDDPSWLPLGPKFREVNGIKRFQRGYCSYAGGGKNSRDTQLFMTFENQEGLGGGSPWEIPWGQLIGDLSYVTLDQIYTGYGESPEQGKIMNRGVEYTKSEFPLMDYINSCGVTAENLYWEHASKSS